MSDFFTLVRNRRSARVPFDPDRPVKIEDLEKILDAATWAPTAHNMQNFKVIVVDDRNILGQLGALKSGLSKDFVQENLAQLSFSEEELKEKKTGLLADMFPPSWRDPEHFSNLEEAAFAEGPSFLSYTIRNSPTLLIVTYDTRKRAPASEGDVLGLISLGCVLENLWLASESLGISFQIMSAFSNSTVEAEVRQILRFPEQEKIAFTIRLGYPKSEDLDDLYLNLRVRRDLPDFVFRNRYGIFFIKDQPRSG